MILIVKVRFCSRNSSRKTFKILFII